MDDLQPAPQAGALPGHGPHRLRVSDPDGHAGLVPLRLVLQPGGLSVELTRPDMLIGRHSEADIRLQLPDVSRRHCRFVFADGRWEVFDLNSLNGLFLNGAKIDRAALRHRDVLQIGSCTFEVDLSLPGTRHPEHVLGSIAEALPRPADEPVPRRLAS